MISTKHLVAALAFALLAGCYGAAADSSGVGGKSGTASGDTGGTVGDGLPCDVQQFLADNCQSCHGAKPSGDAPNSLVTYDQVAKYADVALTRLKDGSMPPNSTLTASDYAPFEKWVNGGKTQDTCADPSVGADPAFDSHVACTSNQMWTRGDRGSSSMHPGRACINCHASSGEAEARTFVFAGTAFPTGHEVDDCSGTPPASTKIEFFDAQNNVLASATVNSAGNFYYDATSRFPKIPAGAKVRIVSGGKSRVMNDTPSSGDCNSCHTKEGTHGAPGRIVYPAGK